MKQTVQDNNQRLEVTNGGREAGNPETFLFVALVAAPVDEVCAVQFLIEPNDATRRSSSVRGDRIFRGSDIVRWTPRSLKLRLWSEPLNRNTSQQRRAGCVLPIPLSFLTACGHFVRVFRRFATFIGTAKVALDRNRLQTTRAKAPFRERIEFLETAFRVEWRSWAVSLGKTEPFLRHGFAQQVGPLDQWDPSLGSAAARAVGARDPPKKIPPALRLLGEAWHAGQTLTWR
jgi:hypothetical protein